MDSEMNNNQNVSKKQNSNLPIIIGATVFVVIILVGILFAFVIRSTDETNKNVEYNEEQTNDNENKNNEQQDDKIDNTNDEEIKVVGDDKYGYVSIPKKWSRFYDIDGNSSLQYSYGNLFIVSLNVIDANQYTAKDYASNYMYNKMNSSDVTGVTGATVKIGKNKEYTAYQVYMYYPTDNVFLITYWFEVGDGKIHYIALEGPGEIGNMKISDYLFIPESFSLTK